MKNGLEFPRVEIEVCSVQGVNTSFLPMVIAVSKTWIEEGLRHLKNPVFVGVEGTIYYVSENYETTFSDHVMENRVGGHFMTGNIAYKKKSYQKCWWF
jgi:hypothetical protein